MEKYYLHIAENLIQNQFLIRKIGSTYWIGYEFKPLLHSFINTGVEYSCGDTIIRFFRLVTPMKILYKYLEHNYGLSDEEVPKVLKIIYDKWVEEYDIADSYFYYYKPNKQISYVKTI